MENQDYESLLIEVDFKNKIIEREIVFFCDEGVEGYLIDELNIKVA